IQTLPIKDGHPYEEPSTLTEIKQSRPAQPNLPKWQGTPEEWIHKLHGGLLARICGCMLGKPVEGATREEIRAWGEETGNWPLHEYFSEPDPAQKERLRESVPNLHFWPGREHPTLGHMNGSVPDDDTNYTMAGFEIVRRWGAAFRPLDVARYWFENLPAFTTYTAERVAYRNLLNNHIPPESATFRNPFREWIGAQIRADYFGYANPGNPELAAEWAWRDASVSHIKNGIYGEMWVAAMLAAAYVLTGYREIIEAGLAQIPAKCRLSDAVHKIVEQHGRGATYEEAVDGLHQRWTETDPHAWCHTISNAEIVAIALLYGDDDYTQTISRAVMAGFDTDCNGATAGSVWGIVHGVEQIPSHWTAPIADKLRTQLIGVGEQSVSDLAGRMVAVAKSAHSPS
ncbi:MAG TPA: ADP-ribosylglycohydrolase family protein, partial [Fimbriimonas sp.]|nr:ADP-ribosylglycohydrolase family protein [Fimbriimonas sp.]